MLNSIYRNEIERVKRNPEGIMTPVLTPSGKGNGAELIYYIKDNSKYINTIGSKPIIELRGQITETYVVVNFHQMVAFNGDIENMLFDSWLNYHSMFSGLESCTSLANQDNVKFKFINEYGCIVKEIEVPNGLKDVAQKYVAISKEKDPWMMQEFDFIKEYQYRKYTTGQILWKSIKQEGSYKEIAKEELARAGKIGSVRVKEIHYFTLG